MQDSEKLEMANRSSHVHLKSRRRIVFDNFLGGISWGVGSVIGASIVVGIIGIIVIRTSTIPLIGDLVRVVMNEIQTGVNEITKNTTE
ncbi:hypothetical protein DOJK_01473 [Patescibacteria group bacterium]|jgi:hypothetical protein|nr:hypothetical protein [Candidatus Dojkabacteria bacterium]CAG1022150.1 hypothetical protein DOJK_01473 [Patescibacteria group bacterium]